MTIEHSDIGVNEIHEPKGAATAVAGQVYVADGAGSGAWQAVAASNTIIVNSLDDLPTPAAGVIQLEDDKRYEFSANITTANRFNLGANNSVTSFNINSPTLTYTGAGDMFTGVDVNFDIRHIQMSCSAGRLFNISDTTGGQYITTIENIRCPDVATFGVFDDLQSLVIDNSSVLSCDDGLSIVGSNWVVLSLNKFALLSTSASFVGIDLGTSVQNNVEMGNLFFSGPSGAIGISGAAASANITAGSLASVTDSSFLGGLTPLSGVIDADKRYSFSGNTGIPDTHALAFITMNSNATATTIGSSSTPVKAAGVFVEQEVALFSSDSTGTITYTGERELRCTIDIVTSSQVASGTDDCTVLLALNGSVITASGQQAEMAAGDPRPFSTIWELTLEENDELEIWVQNDDSTSNITVVDAKFRVVG